MLLEACVYLKNPLFPRCCRKGTGPTGAVSFFLRFDILFIKSDSHAAR